MSSDEDSGCGVCGDELCPGCEEFKPNKRILRGFSILVVFGSVWFAIGQVIQFSSSDSQNSQSGTEISLPESQSTTNFPKTTDESSVVDTTPISSTTVSTPPATATTATTTSTTTVALTLPSNVDQAWREEVLFLTNAERLKEGLDPLVGCNNLHKAAQTHSDAMHEQDFFAHDNPYTGDGVGERSNQAGYGWGLIGENIAMGYASPKDVVSGWMNSLGHRENILNDFKHLGIGITLGGSDRYGKGNWFWWVQNFGVGNPCS